MFGQDTPSALQQQILNVYDRNPDMTVDQIANRCDCSSSYVRETINNYRASLF